MSQNGKEDTKILGPDYDFFERYLVGYYQSNIEGELILDSENMVSKKFYDLILEYDNHDIFLIHGHQVDFLNGTIWWFSKFIVRYMWSALEFIGVSDPTGSAKNNEIIRRVERKLENWSIKNNKILKTIVKKAINKIKLEVSAI